jgi:hypothetical protein
MLHENSETPSLDITGKHITREAIQSNTKRKRNGEKRGQIILLEVSFGLPKFFKPV